MGSTVSTEGESPQMRPADGVLRMSANAAAQLLNKADAKLTRIEKHMSSHVDNIEVMTASLARVTLIEEKMSTLSAQIESLEAKLDAVREAAVELKSLEALDAQHVSTGVLDELTKRLHVGGDPVARGLVVEPVKEGKVDKMRRKRDL